MLEVRNVTKTFFPDTPSEIRALRGVSFTLEEGCFAAVIGSNGSGKSTLLNALGGSFRVDRGEILLGGENITKLPEYRRATRIGRVFQNPFGGTAGEMSIAENLVIALSRGKPRSLKRALTKEILEMLAERVASLKMGLENRLDNPIGTLSGGQRQAITLLMATWNRPDLLLLDEHTAALDPKSAAKVVELTREIVSREKLTTLMVTHSMQQAVDLPDRIIMMHRGRVAEDFKGADKRRLRIPDLMRAFETVAKRDLFDESVGTLLLSEYR